MIFENNSILNEIELKKLNDCVDKVILDKTKLNIDWNLLKKFLEAYIGNQPHITDTRINIVIPMTKANIIAETIEFYESFGEDIFNKVMGAVLQNQKRLKVKIYNFHEQNNFHSRDKDRLPIFSKKPNVVSNELSSTVHVPTNYKLSKNENKAINSEATLLDLYSFVHEIGHLQDLDLSNTAPTPTRELLGEATAIGFEMLLSEFELSKGVISPKAISQQNSFRLKSLNSDVILTYAKLLLAEQKEKNGSINLDFLKSIMQKFNLHPHGARNQLLRIIKDNDGIMEQKRYAIAAILSPTIAKVASEEGGIEKLKNYLDYSKTNEFEKAISELGITLDEKGINTIINNMRNQALKYQSIAEER